MKNSNNEEDELQTNNKQNQLMDNVPLKATNHLVERTTRWDMKFFTNIPIKPNKIATKTVKVWLCSIKNLGEL